MSGTWNADPFATGPGELSMTLTVPAAGGVSAPFAAGGPGGGVGGVPDSPIPGCFTCKFVCGTVLIVPVAWRIWSIAAGAAPEAVEPGAVVSADAVGEIDFVVTGCTCAGELAPGPSVAMRRSSTFVPDPVSIGRRLFEFTSCPRTTCGTSRNTTSSFEIE